MTAEISQPSFFQRHQNFLTGVLLAVLAWMIYFPTTQYGFVYYDDVRILRDHPELYGQPTLAADLREIFITSFPREEPLLLRDVSWALDSKIFGFGNAFGYHLGNVLLHGMVVALMFAFLLGTTRRYGFALAVSVAWLVLAIHTEPVAWIMGRKDILSALFMLLALCAQTRRLAANELRARCGWFIITLICFICGLFSKISVLTFPLVLFLHAVFLPYLNGERSANDKFLWSRQLIREIFLVAPSLVVSLLVYRWYHQTLAQMGIFDRGYTAHGLSHLWNLLMVDPPTLWVYLQQTFFPWHLKIFYQWPVLLGVYPQWLVVISLTFVVVLGGIAVWLFRQHKDLFFFYAAFFVIMVPYLNLVIPGILVAERYLYFSSFCLLALAVTALMARRQQPQLLLRAGGLTVVGGFLAVNLFQTFAYLPAWRNGETLWQYHLTLPSPTPVAYANLAASYYAEAAALQGTPAMAVTMNKMAVVVDAGLVQFWPDHQQTPPPEIYFLFFLKSIVQEVAGEPEAALASLLTADQLHPKFDSTQLNLALLYHKLAAAATDTKQKKLLALAARDRYAEYIKLSYHDRLPPPEVRGEMANLEAAFAAASNLNQSK
jgi:hypothetical protein